MERRKFKRMYEVFEPMREHLADQDLTVEEIICILKARIHPSHRRCLNFVGIG